MDRKRLNELHELADLGVKATAPPNNQTAMGQLAEKLALGLRQALDAIEGAMGPIEGVA